MRCYSCRKYDDCELPWKCDGKMYDCTAYELEQTNEEYLRSLNTEQLAEYILNVWLDGALNVNAEFGLNEAQIERHKKYIVEWLKLPHKE